MKTTRCAHPALQTSIPLFLAPAFAELSITSNATVRSFSSSACHQVRKKRDLNRRRGESVIRSTGPRHALSVQRSYRELPKPVPEEHRPVDKFPINPNHGLYGFFNKDKETVVPGEKEEQHGRAWAIHELTFKSFEDLHALYWQGILEINRVKTRLLEHRRLKLGYGSMEADRRLNTIEQTQKNIKQVLRARQDAYDEAQLRKDQLGFQSLEKWYEAEEKKQREKENRLADGGRRTRLSSAAAPAPAPAAAAASTTTASSVPSS